MQLRCTSKATTLAQDVALHAFLARLCLSFAGQAIENHCQEKQKTHTAWPQGSSRGSFITNSWRIVEDRGGLQWTAVSWPSHQSGTAVRSHHLDWLRRCNQQDRQTRLASSWLSPGGSWRSWGDKNGPNQKRSWPILTLSHRHSACGYGPFSCGVNNLSAQIESDSYPSLEIHSSAHKPLNRAHETDSIARMTTL